MRFQTKTVSVPKGGVFEALSGALKSLSWSPEPKSLSRLGARTKMLFLAKWSPGVKQWSPKDPHFPSRSPGALHFLGWSPGALHLFGIPTSESDMEALAVGRKYFSL